MSHHFLISVFTFLSLLLSAAAAHGGDESTETTSTHENIRSGALIVVKIWCLILVFAGTFAGGISPYYLKWNEAFLVIGTQFAGGVFLGTALMHFLSDSNEKFGDLTSKSYPFAFMLASSGYLMTMLADCVVSYVYRKDPKTDPITDVEVPGDVSEKSNKNGTSTPSQVQAHDAHTHSMKPKFSASSFGDSILLIVALCFHSVFEGIAIGVAETKSGAWRALWTVCLHKIFAAIAMGIALLRMIPDRPLFSCVSYAFAFAISSPIGIAIGIIIDATTQGRVADWIFAISMGIACGVFVYVSVNHLLSKGYVTVNPVSIDTPHHKFLAVLLGIGVIAVVMIWD